MKVRFAHEFKKRFFTSNFLLFILIVVFIWSAIASVKIIHKRKQMSRELAALQEQISKAKERNRQLAELKGIINNPSFLEEQAKKRLGLKREGEEVVVVEEEQIETGVSGKNGDLVQEPKKDNSTQALESNFRKWWKYFFGEVENF